MFAFMTIPFLSAFVAASFSFPVVGPSALFLLLLSFLSIRNLSASHQKPRLSFSKEGTFKVVIFTDLHYGENSWDEWGPQQDVKSTKVMNVILDIEKPGDQITANNLMNTNASNYWEMLTTPCRNREIPWTSVMGNHDSSPFEWDKNWFGPNGIPQPYSIPEDVQFGGERRGRRLLNLQVTTKYSQIQLDKNDPLSFSKFGPKFLWPAIGNYYLPIYNSNQKSIAAFFYFLDSGGGDTPEVISYAQGQFLNNTMYDVNKEGKPEYLFVHIPLPAMETVVPTISDFKIEAPCVGNNGAENVSPVESDWGLIDILENRTSFQASFSGHNHGNDWCCPYKTKLWLCYGRHSGYGGYGRWTRGAKILNYIESPFKLQTWVRFEDGSVSDGGVLSNLRDTLI